VAPVKELQLVVWPAVEGSDAAAGRRTQSYKATVVAEVLLCTVWLASSHSMAGQHRTSSARGRGDSYYCICCIAKGFHIMLELSITLLHCHKMSLMCVSALHRYSPTLNAQLVRQASGSELAVRDTRTVRCCSARVQVHKLSMVTRLFTKQMYVMLSQVREVALQECNVGQ